MGEPHPGLAAVIQPGDLFENPAAKWSRRLVLGVDGRRVSYVAVAAYWGGYRFERPGNCSAAAFYKWLGDGDRIGTEPLAATLMRAELSVKWRRSLERRAVAHVGGTEPRRFALLHERSLQWLDESIAALTEARAALAAAGPAEQRPAP